MRAREPIPIVRINEDISGYVDLNIARPIENVCSLFLNLLELQNLSYLDRTDRRYEGNAP